jgi:hypothetical protein
MSRYTSGQRFDSHIDEPVISEDKSMESEFTLLLYLSDDADQPPLRVGARVLDIGFQHKSCTLAFKARD